MSEAMCAGCGRWPVYYETTQSCSTCLPGRASEVIVDLLARAEQAERERDEARADNERLRGALQLCDQLLGDDEWQWSDGERFPTEEIRAALAGEASGEAKPKRCDHQPIKEEPRRRHATKENGDCADWCRACEDEARARAALAGELDAAELCGSVLDRKGISRKRFRIWERINEYAEACGGDTSPTTVSDRRMRAVVAVESALDAALAGDASGDGEDAEPECGRKTIGCRAGLCGYCRGTPEKAREP